MGSEMCIRDRPIIWKIARSSFFNKLVILLPAALLMKAFAPWLITPLLMLGGMYLCFEGAEKVWHVLAPHKDSHVHVEEIKDPAQLDAWVNDGSKAYVAELCGW